MNTPTKPDADGWIAHDGGECPVLPLDAVQVKNEMGNVFIGQASRFDWAGLVTYRPLVPKHELDKALARVAELEREIDLSEAIRRGL